MSEAEIDDRIYGSKITFTIEESMVVLQMLCKVCMCLLFMKLTYVPASRIVEQWQRKD